MTSRVVHLELHTPNLVRACAFHGELVGWRPGIVRAAELGASVLLAPGEGPAGWRSVVTTLEDGEIALWKTKR